MNAGQHILIFAVRGYQRVVSPALASLTGPLGRCRFEPSCSQYAIEAIRTHGVFRGGALAAWRLLRCGPWGGCGDDPVPEKFQFFQDAAAQVSISNLKFEISDAKPGAIQGKR